MKNIILGDGITGYITAACLNLLVSELNAIP